MPYRHDELTAIISHRVGVYRMIEDKALELLCKRVWRQNPRWVPSDAEWLPLGMVCCDNMASELRLPVGLWFHAHLFFDSLGLPTLWLVMRLI